MPSQENLLLPPTDGASSLAGSEYVHYQVRFARTFAAEQNYFKCKSDTSARKFINQSVWLLIYEHVRRSVI